MTDTFTENLADFGLREIKMLRDLLSAWIEQGLPIDFDNSGVRPALNRNTGCVFLTNEGYAGALLNGDKLESFYFLPHCGDEGFLSDLVADNDPATLHPDDLSFIFDTAKFTGYKLPQNWLPHQLDLL